MKIILLEVFEKWEKVKQDVLGILVKFHYLSDFIIYIAVHFSLYLVVKAKYIYKIYISLGHLSLSPKSDI